MMSGETLRFILQVAAIATGGGFIQLLIFVLKRRSVLRSLDATSGSAALDSANSYIATLQSGEASMRERIAAMQKQWDIERAALTDTLNNERRQVERLAADLARYRADLAVADARITELTSTSVRHGRRSAE